MLKRYDVEHIIVGHTIFKDISTFYDGRVIGVNVDNEENRKKKRGRALLIDGNTYLVVGDKGTMRKLFWGCFLSDYFLGVEVRGFHGETKKNSAFFA